MNDITTNSTTINTTTANTYANVLFGGCSNATTSGGYPYMQTWCTICSQFYTVGNLHFCSPQIQPLQPSTANTINWVPPMVVVKDLIEVVTDSPLEYIANVYTADLVIPTFLSECFINLSGDSLTASWVSLFPLIFSAEDVANGKHAFYLVKDITSKLSLFNDKVKLVGVKLIEIKDNLDLMQLAERTKSFLKK